MPRLNDLVAQVGNKAVAEFLGLPLLHTRGARYKLGGDKDDYILAEPEAGKAALINMTDGNRWRDAAPWSGNIPMTGLVGK